MATNDNSLCLNDKSSSTKHNNSFAGHDTQQFSNLNLNQTSTYSNVSFVQSHSKSNVIVDNKQFAICPITTCSTVPQYNETTQKSFNKSTDFCSKGFNPLSLNGKIEEEYEAKKLSKNKNSLKIPLNSSTLSLHIAAYENNSGETVNGNTSNDESKSLKSEQSLIKKWKNAESSLAVQNCFEFPRQQRGNRPTRPEVMQFKASQRLLNPNTFRPSNPPRFFNMMSRFPPPSRPSLQQQQQPSEKALRSVYVGNIGFDVNEEELKQMLAKIGPVIGFRIVRDHDTGKSKGFGFCEYLDPETANRCIRQMNNLEFKGRNLRIDSAVLNERAMNDDSAPSSQNQMSSSSSSFRPRSPHHDETSMYGPAPLNGKTPEAIAKTLSKCSPEIMFEVMRDMKNLATTNPQRCRQLLETNQQLAFALLQAQVMMHWLDTDAAFNLIDRKSAQDKAAAAVAPEPPQEPIHHPPAITRQPLRPTPTQLPPSSFRQPLPPQQQLQQQGAEHQFFQHTPPLPQQQQFRQQFFPPPQQPQRPPVGQQQWQSGPPPSSQQQRMPPPQQFASSFDSSSRFPPPSTNSDFGNNDNYRNNSNSFRPTGPPPSNFHNMPPPSQRPHFPPPQQQQFRPSMPPQQHFQQPPPQRHSNDTVPEDDAEDYEMIEELLQLSEEQINQLPPVEAAKIREIRAQFSHR